MSTVKIQKAKLIEKGDKLEVAYVETKDDGSKASVDYECDTPVHTDLKKAINGLAVHLAILTDQISEKQAKDPENFKSIHVNGFSEGGKEGAEGFQILGYRTTKRGGTVTLNTPFTRFEQSEENAYILMKDLEDKLESVKDEVHEYLFNGKRAPEAQQELPFEEPVTKLVIDDPAQKPLFKEEPATT